MVVVDAIAMRWRSKYADPCGQALAVDDGEAWTRGRAAHKAAARSFSYASTASGAAALINAN
jgi:hypothetical protein